MSSFMKQFISKESLLDQISFEDIEEITPEEDVELAEANGQVELARQEIQQAVEASDRVSAVQNELQAQNEVAEGIMEANGGQLPTEAAAGIEAGRRSAAVALGLDPDSEEGQAIVNQPQIDAMVRGEAQPATEDDNKSKGLMAALKKIWEWIKEKAESFVNWIKKIINLVSKKHKAVYNKVKSAKADVFEYSVGALKSDKSFAEKYTALFENGKLISLSDKSKMVREIMSALDMGFMTAIKHGIAMYRADDKGSVMDEYAEKVVGTLQKNLENKEFILNGKKFTIMVGNTTAHLEVENIKSTFEAFTQSDALKALNITEFGYNKIEKQLDAAKAAGKDVENKVGKYPTDAGIKLMGVIRSYINILTKLGAEYNGLISKMASMLNTVATLATKKEKKEDDNKDK